MYLYLFDLLLIKKINVLVSNSVGFGGSIDLVAILDFVDSGHDLIIAANLIRSEKLPLRVELILMRCVLVCKHFDHPIYVQFLKCVLTSLWFKLDV